MSKRSFAEINTVLELIELSRSQKRPKLELTMLAKKRTFKKRRREGGTVASTVNRILDKRLESKKIDSNVGGSDILNTPLFIDVYSMAQGATGATRIGVEISPTYLELKISITANSATLPVPFMRLMVVQSKEGPLVVGDMPAAYGGVPDTDLFNVLTDRMVTFSYSPGVALASTVTAGFVWTYSKILKRAAGIRQTIRYDSTTAATNSGGIYVFAISGDADIDVDDGYIRGLYKDG